MNKVSRRCSQQNVNCIVVKGREFNVVEKIGNGTYGKVYHAKYRGKQPDSRFPVKDYAIKIVASNGESDGVASTAIREIMLLKVLNHKNLVSLYDCSISTSGIHLVMELCDMDLKCYIRSCQTKNKKIKDDEFEYKLMVPVPLDYREY